MRAATYVSESSFTVNGNFEQFYETGLAVELVQGADPSIKTYVSGASYNAETSKTTVTVGATSLTANLTEVLNSRVSPSSIPSTVPQLVNGLIPSQLLPPMGGLPDGVYLLPITSQNQFRSALPVSQASPAYFALSSNRAYFVYLGLVAKACVPVSLWCRVALQGTGTPVADCGLFSTPNAPNGQALVFTKIAAVDMSSDIYMSGGTGNAKNTSSPFGAEVAAGTHLWAGLRVAYGSGQPSLYMLNYVPDWGKGEIQVCSSAGALTNSSSTWTGQVWVGNMPDLRVTLD
jgi:hypothetical protein